MDETKIIPPFMNHKKYIAGILRKGNEPGVVPT